MKRAKRAFSLVEVLITVSVIGILAAAAVWTVTRVVGATCEQKLESDQATLNRAVKAFVATGGTLDGLETPQEVLAAMKRPAASGGRTAGLAGSTIDPRLTLVMQTSVQARSGQARLYWDSGLQRFEFATRGKEPGVAEVVYDAMAGTNSDEVAERNQRVLYAKESKRQAERRSVGLPPSLDFAHAAGVISAI